MKRLNITPITNRFLKLRYLNLMILLFICLSFANKSSAQISGPSDVCPSQEQTFSVNFGLVIFPCEYNWFVLRNGAVIDSHRTTSSSFTHEFDNTLGPVTVRVILSRGVGCFSTSTANKTVNIGYHRAPAPITGSSFICHGQTKSFHTNGLANNSADCFFHHKYMWTVPAGWTVEGQSGSYVGGKTVDIKAPSSGSDQIAQIIVQGYYDDIHELTASRTYTIRLGKPAAPASVFGQSSLPANQVGDYWISPVKGATSYSWTKPGNWNLIDNNGSSITVVVNNNSGYIRVRAVNSCGSSAQKSKFVQVNSSGGGGGGPLLVAEDQFKVFPNPSGSYLHIADELAEETSASEISKSESIASKVSLKLLDSKGVLYLSEQMSGKTHTMDLKKLNNGQYVLHIIAGNQTVVKHITVQK